MCELTRSTFMKVLPDIEKYLKLCDYVAIDTEFSGLSLGHKNSLFDSPAERYEKLKAAIGAFTLLQIGKCLRRKSRTFCKDNGISIFVKEKDRNRYVAHTYNIYLFPSTFGPKSSHFLCQVSSLEFLSSYGFDFNKFIYEGVPYLNEEEEDVLQEFLDNDCSAPDSERNMSREDELTKQSSIVADWLMNQKSQNLVLNMDLHCSELMKLILILELHRRFPSILASVSEFGDVIVEKVGEEKRLSLESEGLKAIAHQKERVYCELLGFSKVFKLLVKYKVPVVGHNLFMDLLFIYQKFYRSLPKTYTTFKKNLNGLLPLVFDTKHMAYCIKASCKDLGITDITRLDLLHTTFNSCKNKHFIIGCPEVIHSSQETAYSYENGRPHEAGYDAFQSGSVFLRFLHVIKFYDSSVYSVYPCDFKEYLKCVGKYSNKINIARASVFHIDLASSDPVSNRPNYLYISSKSGRLDVNELKSMLSMYDLVDIMMSGYKTAFVATTSFRSYRVILKAFHGHKFLKVVPYNKWKHSRAAKVVTLLGVGLFTGITIWAVVQTAKDVRSYLGYRT